MPQIVDATGRWPLEVAAGTDELLATVYSYTLRQAKYRNPTADLALAFATGAHGKLGGD